MDPILTPLFVSGLVGIGISASTAAIVAPILTSFVLAATALGLSLLFTPELPKPEGGKIAVQEPVAPRQYAYGTARLAGAVMLRETDPNGNDLSHNAALVSHRISAFHTIYLNDNQCTFDGDSYPADPQGEW